MLIRAMGRFVVLLVLLSGAVAVVSAHADSVEDYIKKMTENCKELTRKQTELAQQAAQKGQTTSPALDRLNALATSAQKLIDNGPPRDPAQREEYARKLAAIVGEGGMVTRSVLRGLGMEPMGGVLQRRLDANADGLLTKYGRFDGAAKAYNPTPEGINIPRRQDSDFFGVRRAQPPSNASGAVLRTSESDALKITDHDGSWGGGVLLEGKAAGIWRNPRVSYSAEFNAFTLDNRAVYFLDVAPWAVAALCLAIRDNDKELVGVSLTGTDRLFFGAKQRYQNSDVGRDLLIADRFLADVVFAYKKWTKDYKFFQNFTPQASQSTGRLAVRFAFGGFRFRIDDEEFRAEQPSLEVRFAPLTEEVAADGGLVPDYAALRKGFEPPAEYAFNARHLTDHIEYYRQERIVNRMFRYGEVAAFLRGLKAAGVDLPGVAREIVTMY